MLAPPKEPDCISIDGMELPLLNNPLEAYFQATRTSSPFRDLPTDATDSRPLRGHVATWSIENGHLCLTKVTIRTARQQPAAEVPRERPCGEEPEAGEFLNHFGVGDYYARSIDLAELFPGCLSPIEAWWYSGNLRVGRGNVLRYHYDHRGYNLVYEQVEHVEVRAGRVVSRRLLDGYEVLQGRAEAMMREAVPELRRWGQIAAGLLLALLLFAGTGLVNVHPLFGAFASLTGLGLFMAACILWGTLGKYRHARRAFARYQRQRRAAGLTARPAPPTSG